MIKVLVVDPHPVFRLGMETLIKRTADVHLAGSLKSGVEIFEFVRRQHVDVIVLEVDLPELNGITTLRAIKKEHKDIAMLMVSNQPEEIYAVTTVKAGASGYLHKTVEGEQIIEAIKKIHAGGIALSPEMSKQLTFNDSKMSTSRIFKRLSTREVEVLKLLSIGKKNKEISAELDINEKTVSTYKARLYKKLNVTNLVDLVHQAKHQGIT